MKQAQKRTGVLVERATDISIDPKTGEFRLVVIEKSGYGANSV